MKKMKIFLIFGFIAVLVVILGVSFISIKANAQEDTTEIKLLSDEQTTQVEETETEEEVENNSNKEVNDWVKEWFSADKVAMYISWLAYIGTIIGLVANIKKLKQTNNLTLKNVSDDVKKVVKDTVETAVIESNEKYIPKVLATQDRITKVMEIFAKILALSQENTPESRVAILNLIQELGLIGNELVENAKEIIEDGEKIIKEHEEKMNKNLDEIIEKYDGTSI